LHRKISGFASLYPTYQLPLLDFSDIRGKKKKEYFAAVQAGMDRNYEPMTTVFSDVIRKTLRTHER